jgi:hypothetical protein
VDATPEEQWHSVVGFEGMYEVSDKGHVRSLARPTRNGIGRPILDRILAPDFVGKRRYPQVSLYKDGKETRRRIHQLVLEAFVGPCPPGQECLHANDIASDNRLENLRWDTRSANANEKVRNGNHPNARKTHCKNGHEFTPENTIRPPSYGGRQCRECKRNAVRIWRQRNKGD